MTIQTIIQTFGLAAEGAVVEISTLGSQSRFLLKRLNHGLELTNSLGNRYAFDQETLTSVHQRYLALPHHSRLRAAFYTDSNWPQTPSRIFAPYIAAVIAKVTNRAN